jgi:hypothetical protein
VPSKFRIGIVPRQSPVPIGIECNGQSHANEVLGLGVDARLRDKPVAEQNASHEEGEESQDNGDLRETEPALSPRQAGLADQSCEIFSHSTRAAFNRRSGWEKSRFGPVAERA